MSDLFPIIITALISPLFLKIVEYILNKNSERTKAQAAKVEALAARIDEYRDDKLKLEIKIGVLEAQLKQKDDEISKLQKQAQQFESLLVEKDREIAKLQGEVADLLERNDNK